MTAAHRTPRTSDRLLTPAVIVTIVIVGGGLVALVIASVAWLTAQGLDPDPMLRLTAQSAAAVGVLINLLVSLGGRAGVAKVERTTGRDLPAKVDDLSSSVAALAQKVDAALWVDAKSTTSVMPPIRPPVPDSTLPHPLRMGTAPASRGEQS